MLLKELFERYRDQLEQKYGHRLLPSQRRAIDDIINCRTPVLGEILSTCPHCGVNHTRPHSCGNRNCPVCQNHLAAMRRAQIGYESKLHKTEWVVNIRAAGKGEPALKYLSRYLYRGVIQEKNILNDENGLITFKYLEAKTDTWQTRTLPAVDFLHLLLTHVLPKRFRRVRTYGFLHGNAATTLHKIQLILKSTPTFSVSKPRPRLLKCPDCGATEIVINYDFRRGLKPSDHIRGSPT